MTVIVVPVSLKSYHFAWSYLNMFLGSTALQYVSALASREIEWIKGYAVPRYQPDPLFVSKSQNTPAGHVTLLQKFLTVAPYIVPREGETIKSFLWHTDLHSKNILSTKMVILLVSLTGRALGRDPCSLRLDNRNF